jgi:hypothetical protein
VTGEPGARARAPGLPSAQPIGHEIAARRPSAVVFEVHELGAWNSVLVTFLGTSRRCARATTLRCGAKRAWCEGRRPDDRLLVDSRIEYKCGVETQP